MKDDSLYIYQYLRKMLDDIIMEMKKLKKTPRF